MNSSDYLFCSGKLRPDVCLQLSKNMCCFNCDKNLECHLANKLSKIKPCTSKVLSNEEICEFMI